MYFNNQDYFVSKVLHEFIRIKTGCISCNNFVRRNIVRAIKCLGNDRIVLMRNRLL